MKKFLKELDEIIKVQCSEGNQTDEYMRGLANGLILARSVATGEEPKYLDKQVTKDVIKFPSAPDWYVKVGKDEEDAEEIVQDSIVDSWNIANQQSYRSLESGVQRLHNQVTVLNDLVTMTDHPLDNDDWKILEAHLDSVKDSMDSVSQLVKQYKRGE